jgi:hypothetical protein
MPGMASSSTYRYEDESLQTCRFPYFQIKEILYLPEKILAPFGFLLAEKEQLSHCQPERRTSERFLLAIVKANLARFMIEPIGYNFSSKLHSAHLSIH